MENEAKRKRQPVRTPQEKLEDAFMDLSVHDQVKALATFETLHRMKQRLADSFIPLLKKAARHCTDCGQKLGSQHAPSCHRQGLVTELSDYNNPQGSLIDGTETASRAKP